jgi:Clr5 domain
MVAWGFDVPAYVHKGGRRIQMKVLEPHKELVRRLYYDEKLGVEEIHKRLKDEHGVPHSMRSLERAKQNWGFRRNLPPSYDEVYVKKRIRELWATHHTNKDILKILNNEGVQINRSRLKVLRTDPVKGLGLYIRPPREDRKWVKGPQGWTEKDVDCEKEIVRRVEALAEQSFKLLKWDEKPRDDQGQVIGNAGAIDGGEQGVEDDEDEAEAEAALQQQIAGTLLGLAGPSRAVYEDEDAEGEDDVDFIETEIDAEQIDGGEEENSDDDSSSDEDEESLQAQLIAIEAKLKAKREKAARDKGKDQALTASKTPFKAPLLRPGRV